MSTETASPSMPAASPGAAVSVDGRGKAFDPKVHRTNPDGSPFVGKHGRFMPRGGRKPKPRAPLPTVEPSKPAQPAEPARPEPSKPSAPLPAPDFSDVRRIVGNGGAQPSAPGAEFAAVEVVESISHETSAEGYLRSGYVVADAILSGRGEWQPEAQSEHDGLKASLVSLLKALDAKPHPVLAFCLAALAYVLKRARQPRTAATLVRWFPDLAPVLGVEVTAKPAAQPAARPQTAANSGVQAESPVQAETIVKSRATNEAATADKFFGS